MTVRAMNEKRARSVREAGGWRDESGGSSVLSSFLKSGSESDRPSPSVSGSLVSVGARKSTSSNRPDRERGVLGIKPSGSGRAELTALSGIEVIWREGALAMALLSKLRVRREQRFVISNSFATAHMVRHHASREKRYTRSLPRRRGQPKNIPTLIHAGRASQDKCRHG